MAGRIRQRRVTIKPKLRPGPVEWERSRSLCRNYLPAGVAVPRRVLRRRELRSGHDQVVPYCYEDDASLDRLMPQIPDALGASRTGFLRHRLAGDCGLVLSDEHRSLVQDIYSGYMWWQWGPWDVARLFYGCGLVGFPLSSRFPALLDWADEQTLRLFALIVMLRLDRMGSRLRARAASLAVLMMLAALAAADPRLGRSVGADEPAPSDLPRAPGVDPFGLFVPRC